MLVVIGPVQVLRIMQLLCSQGIHRHKTLPVPAQAIIKPTCGPAALYGCVLSVSRTITLNDPKKRNALSLSMLTALRADLLADIDSEELRVIIICGMSHFVPLIKKNILPEYMAGLTFTLYSL